MKIGISAMGLATSVGHSAADSCASIRAGLQRPCPVAGFEVLDGDEQEAVALTARPMAGVTDGFEGIGRWVVMAAAAARDLAGAPGVDAASRAFWEGAAFCAVLPESDDRRFDAELPWTRDPARSLVASLQENLRWPIDAAKLVSLRTSHAGLAHAIESAAPRLTQAQFQRLIVCAVDTYVDAASLEWLLEEDRLKLEEQPFGVIPGEAAAWLVVETGDAARARGASLLAEVAAAAFVPGKHGFRAHQPMLGESLHEAVTRSLAACGEHTLTGFVFSDLNGEPWRAHELGCAQQRLGEKLPAAQAQWLLPASSLGETGAASASVAACAALASWQRGYGPRATAAVLSTSEAGHAGCVLLRPAPR